MIEMLLQLFGIAAWSSRSSKSILVAKDGNRGALLIKNDMFYSDDFRRQKT
jgi:hypothetical protein